MYFLHQTFPEIVGTEYTLRDLDYVLGVHRVSNVSYVSEIGAQSKLIAYGNNRADCTFIPGGMIPGVTVVQPDFPELTSDWFLWYENEYVVDAATAFILAANCANVAAHEPLENVDGNRAQAGSVDVVSALSRSDVVSSPFSDSASEDHQDDFYVATNN